MGDCRETCTSKCRKGLSRKLSLFMICNVMYEEKYKICKHVSIFVHVCSICVARASFEWRSCISVLKRTSFGIADRIYKVVSLLSKTVSHSCIREVLNHNFFLFRC